MRAPVRCRCTVAERLFHSVDDIDSSDLSRPSTTHANTRCMHPVRFRLFTRLYYTIGRVDVCTVQRTAELRTIVFRFFRLSSCSSLLSPSASSSFIRAAVAVVFLLILCQPSGVFRAQSYGLAMATIWAVDEMDLFHCCGDFEIGRAIQ